MDITRTQKDTSKTVEENIIEFMETRKPKLGAEYTIKEIANRLDIGYHTVKRAMSRSDKIQRIERGIYSLKIPKGQDLDKGAKANNEKIPKGQPETTKGAIASTVERGKDELGFLNNELGLKLGLMYKGGYSSGRGNNDLRRLIYSYLIHEGLTQKEIVKSKKIPRNTVNYHVKKLLKEGAIIKTRQESSEVYNKLKDCNITVYPAVNTASNYHGKNYVRGPESTRYDYQTKSNWDFGGIRVHDSEGVMLTRVHWDLYKCQLIRYQNLYNLEWEELNSPNKLHRYKLIKKFEPYGTVILVLNIGKYRSSVIIQLPQMIVDMSTDGNIAKERIKAVADFRYDIAFQVRNWLGRMGYVSGFPYRVRDMHTPIPLRDKDLEQFVKNNGRLKLTDNIWLDFSATVLEVETDDLDAVPAITEISQYPARLDKLEGGLITQQGELESIKTFLKDEVVESLKGIKDALNEGLGPMAEGITEILKRTQPAPQQLEPNQIDDESSMYS